MTANEVAVAFGMFLASGSFLAQAFSSHKRKTEKLDRTTDILILVGVLIMFIGVVNLL